MMRCENEICGHDHKIGHVPEVAGLERASVYIVVSEDTGQTHGKNTFRRTVRKPAGALAWKRNILRPA